MKLISRYKDYYDYLIHLYGEDPSIIYHRNFIKHPDAITYKEVLSKLPRIPVYYGRNNYAHDIFRFKWLILCGERYLLIAKRDEKTISGFNYTEYSIVNSDDMLILSRYYNLHDLTKIVGEYSPRLAEANVMLNSPCFIWDGYAFGEYDCINNETRYRIPKLSLCGLASVLPADKIYTKLEGFLVNTMRGTPDTKPPVEIADKYKITGHGFDIKQSFRHR